MMFSHKAILIFICIFIRVTNLSSLNNTKYDFPLNFKFGASTSAYQIEGGWNSNGKGPSIWDEFVHNFPNRIKDHTNGDIAADSYHYFQKDLNALKFMRAKFYRFSISWSRVLPNGNASSLNQFGILYYKNIIDNLINNGIEPMVTMYHDDLPNELQKLGGFSNPLIIKYFVEYARVLFTEFGNKVKYWITFNGSSDYCISGYGKGESPPLINASGIKDYLCVDHTLKSHASVYHLYKNEFYEKQKGKIGITVSAGYFFSKSNDTKLIERGLQFTIGWLTHPIFSQTGDYPPIMIDVIGTNSNMEGREKSRLPIMTDEWKNKIQGAGDFIGINYYTSSIINKRDRSTGTPIIPSWEYDCGFIQTIDSSWKKANSEWLYSVPEGLGHLLRWLKKEYNNVEVIITENGWSDHGEIFDDDRINYLRDHLIVLSDAINDGCKVTGYAVWSLIDNFEWTNGYTQKFGLFRVDFKNPGKDRFPKKSADFMRTVIETRIIPVSASATLYFELQPLLIFTCLLSVSFHLKKILELNDV